MMNTTHGAIGIGMAIATAFFLPEFGDQAESNAIVRAPHGGDVQPHTDSQAEYVSEALGDAVSLWGTKGYRKGGGAFVRWYQSHPRTANGDLKDFLWRFIGSVEILSE